MHEHQPGEHERPARAEIPQLAPQPAGVAAQHAGDAVAQRRDERHDRRERSDAEEREPDAAVMVHLRSVGTLPQRNVNVS